MEPVLFFQPCMHMCIPYTWAACSLPSLEVGEQGAQDSLSRAQGVTILTSSIWSTGETTAGGCKAQIYSYHCNVHTAIQQNSVPFFGVQGFC